LGFYFQVGDNFTEGSLTREDDDFRLCGESSNPLALRNDSISRIDDDRRVQDILSSGEDNYIISVLNNFGRGLDVDTH